MKKISVALIFFCLSFIVFSQKQEQAKIDSLINIIISDKPDTNKVKHILSLVVELRENYPDSAMSLCNNALHLSEKINWQTGIGQCYHQIATIYGMKGEYNFSLQFFTKALDVWEQLEKKVPENQKSEIKSQQSKSIGNIGNVYYYQGDFAKALHYFLMALKMDEDIGNKNGIARHFGNIGNIYKKQGDNLTALDYETKALKMYKEIGNKDGIATVLQNFGDIYTATKKYTEAESSLLNALSLFDSINGLYGVMQVSEDLSNLYTLTGKEKKALDYYKKYIAAKDTLYNEEKEKENLLKEMNYEFEKKQAAAKAEQDKKVALAAAEIKRQTLIKNSILGGVAIAGIFTFLLVRTFNHKRKIIFDKKVSEVEMVALRSQMNPHFIFNSLNSIDDYILNNDTKNSSLYINKFSKLMRLILENSRKQKVPLEKDLAALELYMQLESLHFHGRFQYHIVVDSHIDKENTMIPPMLLQPFVENSILHGLSTKENGMININVKKFDDMIRCTVEDNGIGRNQSVKIETGEEKKRESLGMKITEERLHIINQMKKIKVAVNIFDMMDEKNQPGGMQVELLLPYEQAF